MSAGKPTGPGRIRVDHVDPKNPVFEIHPVKSITLENYNVDGDELKVEHTRFLAQRLLEYLWKYRGIYLQLDGFASRTGANAYNRQLSARRIENLVRYLVSKKIAQSRIPFSLMNPHGESKSVASSEEAPQDRSVRITLVHNYRPRPRPKPKGKSTPGKPELPDYIPIPPRHKDDKIDLVKEIYMKYEYWQRPGNEKPSKVPGKGDQWRRLDEHTTWGLVDLNSTGRVGVAYNIAERQFKDNTSHWALGGHLKVKYKTAMYKYDPASVPNSGPSFILPQYAEGVFDLYDRGSLATPPSNGPV